MHRLNITPKLATIFAFFALLVLTGSGYFYYSGTQSRLHEKTEAEMFSTIFEKQAAMEEWLDEKRNDLYYLTTSPSVLRLAERLVETNDGQDDQAYQLLLEEFDSRTGPGREFKALSILDPVEGRVILTTMETLQPDTRWDDFVYIQGKHRIYTQTPFLDPALGVMTMQVAGPLVSEQGELLGVLVGKIELSSLERIIARRTGLNKSDDAYLLNQAHAFVTPPRLTGGLDELPAGDNSLAASRCLDGESGELHAPDFRGVESIFMYQWLPDVGLCLIFKVDEVEALAPEREIGWMTLSVVGMVLLAAIGVAVLFSRMVTRPLRQLKQGVERIEMGDLDFRLPVKSGDELGRLAAGFNTMAARIFENERLLRRHAANLEAEVRLRTAALQSSEAELRALFSAMQDLVIVLDRDGYYLRINPANQSLLYLPEEELLGKSIAEVFPAETAGQFMATIRETLDSMETVSLEYPIMIDEEERWFLASVSPLTEDSVLWVARDVSRRRITEQALKQSERLNRAIIEESPLGIAVRDRAGRLVLSNQAWMQIWGESEAEIERARRKEIKSLATMRRVFPYLGKSAGDMWKIFRQGGSLYLPEIKTKINKNDAATWVAEHHYGILNENGEVERLVTITQDISERKKAVDALQHSERLNRAVVENSPVGISIRDANRKLVYANQAWTKIWGITPESLAEQEEKRGATLFSERFAHLPDIVRQSEEVLERGGSFFIAELEVEDALPGAAQWVSIYLYAIKDDHDRLLQTVALTQDISDRKQREREQEIQVTISAALRTAVTRAEMGPLILEKLRELLKVEASGFIMRDPFTGEAVFEAGSGAWSHWGGGRLPVGAGISGELFTTGEPFVNNEIQSDERLVRKDMLGDVTAVAGVPLIVREQVIGLLWAGSLNPFSNSSLRLLTNIGELAAITMHRATLYEQTEQRLQRMTAMRAIDQAIMSSLDLRVTLNILLDKTISHLNVDAAAVLLFNPESQTLEYIAYRGFRSRQVAYTRTRIGQPNAGRVVLERRPILIPDITAAPGSQQNELMSAEGFLAYGGIPLVAKGQVKGVLEIYHRQCMTFEPEWREFFDTLAGLAAISIDNAALFESVQRTNLDLTLAYDTTLEQWAQILEERDGSSKGHTRRLMEQAITLGRLAGLSDDELVQLRRGVLLHDIGKLTVPDAVLLKTSPLTVEEWSVIRTYPERAREILLPITYLKQAVDIPACLHERWDGSGYPRGLKGDAIPLAARIFSIVNVWETLLQDRPYRKAWSEQEAAQYIRDQAGRQFDANLVAMFLDAQGVGMS